MSLTLKEKDLTGQIIGCFYKVYNTLGFGFLEKVYENALKIELRKSGLLVDCQRKIAVHYEGEPVGDYYADIVVNGTVILELKAMEAIHPAHEAQLLNYLKATEVEIGLLLNFGPKPTFSRKVFSNYRKTLRAPIPSNIEPE